MKCVYKISCVDSNIKEFYIGSTDDLKIRINLHSSNCYNINSSKYNYKVYKFIREHGGLSNWEINPIEIYECEMTKEELKIVEQNYLDEYEPELNMLRAIGLTKEEYYENRKEHYLQYKKDWYQKNKSKILEKNKKNYIPKSTPTK